MSGLIKRVEDSIKTLRKDDEKPELRDLLLEVVQDLNELQAIKNYAKRLNDKWEEDEYTDTGEANDLLNFILNGGDEVLESEPKKEEPEACKDCNCMHNPDDKEACEKDEGFFIGDVVIDKEDEKDHPTKYTVTNEWMHKDGYQILVLKPNDYEQPVEAANFTRFEEPEENYGTCDECGAEDQNLVDGLCDNCYNEE